MQEPDRKIAWAAVFTLGILALLFAWFLFVGPTDYHAGYTAKCEADCDVPWWHSSSFWLVFFTAALTASTALLWLETKRLAKGADQQARDMRTSLRIAIRAANASRRLAAHAGDQLAQLEKSVTASEKAADAATLSAKAAVGVNLPFLHIEKVEGSTSLSDARAFLKAFNPSVTFKNYGATPAFISNIVVNVLAASGLPAEPSYAIVNKFPRPIVLDARSIHQHTEFLWDVAGRITDEQIDDILANPVRGWLHVFGYIDFTDFMGIPHRKGFAYFMYPKSLDFAQDHTRPNYQHQT